MRIHGMKLLWIWKWFILFKQIGTIFTSFELILIIHLKKLFIKKNNIKNKKIIYMILENKMFPTIIKKLIVMKIRKWFAWFASENNNYSFWENFTYVSIDCSI